jgi:hypothetical protein
MPGAGVTPPESGASQRGELDDRLDPQGLLINPHHSRGAIANGIEHFEAGTALAWPSFATVDDVAGLPRTIISVNGSRAAARRR